METMATTIEVSGYCMTCTDEVVATMLCRRPGSEFFDNGADRDTEQVPARYEGVCYRCCGHNHG